MSETVFILGAGASKSAGVPLMNEFLDVARRLYQGNKVGDKAAEFELVLKAIGALQVVHSKAELDLHNIESVFNALEMARLIQRLPGFNSEDIETIIAALKQVIVTTIQSTMKFPTHSSQILAPKPYDSFLDTLAKFKRGEKYLASVITFNYDVGMDWTLAANRIPVNYGIDSNGTRKANSFDLLKLHGSLNWGLEKSTREIIPLEIHRYREAARPWLVDNTARVTIGSDLFAWLNKHDGRDIESQPVIVPPSWNKSDYQFALTAVWAKAADCLAKATNIVVIGYSLPETDSYFRLLYSLGSVGDSPLERFIVFNPDISGATERRFKELLGPGARSRFSYEPLTFEDGIHRLNQIFPLPV